MDGRHSSRRKRDHRADSKSGRQCPNPVRVAFFSFLASRFSFSDFPGFFPEDFCGDFSGTMISFVEGEAARP
jgi:hypothetical protein